MCLYKVAGARTYIYIPLLAIIALYISLKFEA